MKKWNALRTAVAICLLLCLALMPAALGEGINTGDFDEVYDMLDTWFEDEPAAEEEKTDVDAIYAFTLDGASYAFPCPMNALLNNGWNYAGWAADEGAALEAMTYANALLVNAAQERLTVEIMNPGEVEIPVEEALLMSVQVSANDTPPAFATAAGLSLGMDYAAVAEIYGEGGRENPMAEGGMNCRYSFYQLLNETPSSIAEPLTQGSGEDELSVTSDTDGAIISIYMKHAKF